MQRKASKHRARDAGEKADLRHYHDRTAASAEIAVPLSRREVRKPVGPLDPRRPARPRANFEKRIGRMTRANTRRENDGACVEIASDLAGRKRVSRELYIITRGDTPS